VFEDHLVHAFPRKYATIIKMIINPETAIIWDQSLAIIFVLLYRLRGYKPEKVGLKQDTDQFYPAFPILSLDCVLRTDSIFRFNNRGVKLQKVESHAGTHIIPQPDAENGVEFDLVFKG